MPGRVEMFYITSESKFGTNEISNQGHHLNILDICIILYDKSATSLLSISLKINIATLIVSSFPFASTPMLSSFGNW